jgi:hypothetical protein
MIFQQLLIQLSKEETLNNTFIKELAQFDFVQIEGQVFRSYLDEEMLFVSVQVGRVELMTNWKLFCTEAFLRFGAIVKLRSRETTNFGGYSGGELFFAVTYPSKKVLVVAIEESLTPFRSYFE